MTDFKPQICCPNPTCIAPLNSLGSKLCATCQTPLIYRYLWATGQFSEQVPVGTQLAGKYFVTAPQIWLDTQPTLAPDVPTDWPEDVLPYLHLYPYRLHIPEVYGFCSEIEGLPGATIFLLDNVPLNQDGLLYPAIAQAWSYAPAVRQVYWLWQLFQLWIPLQEQGVAASLLAADNIRVDGWRLRLCQLYKDADVLTPTLEPEEVQITLGLSDLANLWLSWVRDVHPSLVQPLTGICYQMQAEESNWSAIATQLNQLLLEQAAQLPLQIKVAGITDSGPQRAHNEDACYPTTVAGKSQSNKLMTQVALVCDGIGGHEGGEVASQMAVQSFKLQIQALLAEVAQQSEVLQPDLVAQQLEAMIRVVNNLIATQNDLQGREDRRRMGTTLMMALQLPQRIQTAEGISLTNGHELYLAHVGDSRAYWITQRYCHPLTVDDDVASREVRMGRSLYWESLRRSDAGALTQALGTKNAEFLHPTIQRFILEEDGLLLLCSDGLSDNDLVEQNWTEYAVPVLKGKQTLETAAREWVNLANQRNGHDNTSVVLIHCRVTSAIEPVLPTPVGLRQPVTAPADWSAASRALLQDEATTAEATQRERRPKRTLVRWLVGLTLFLLLGSGTGLLVWASLDPSGFQHLRERVLPNPPSSSPK